MTETFGVDSNFPDRPQTEEFRKISAVYRALDDTEPEDHFTDDEMTAVFYIAENRVTLAVQELKGVATLHDVIAALCLDSFTAGMQYERSKTDG